MKQFFDEIKPLFGRLSQTQVDGINVILETCKEFELNTSETAYVLATAFHETWKTMQPIAEIGKGKKYDYGLRLKMNRKPYFDSTNIFYGRGFVQVTWYENYKKLTKANDKGWDFFSNPHLLLELIPSAWAMVYGMKTGLFTGKKLSTFIQQNDLQKNDFINARKVVNGLDKAEQIAEYAQTFKNALS